MPAIAAPVRASRIGGRYLLGDAIGSGGMGTVWRAHDELLNRAVAIKEVFPASRVTDEERAALREQSLREARAAARISCSAAVTVYDVVVQDDRPWIVMELLEARSLAQTLRSEGPMPVHAAIDLGLAVLTALEAAHEAGVVHRDVKPANVLLAYDGRIALTDFGVATLDGDAGTTITGLVLGSPAYIAPERARGIPPAPAMDLWGLGATLFAAVEGRGPFHRQDALTTLNAVLTEPVPRAEQAGVLRPVIEGLLERDPDQRLAAPAVRMLLEEAARQEVARTDRAIVLADGLTGGSAELDVSDLDTAAIRLSDARQPQDSSRGEELTASAEPAAAVRAQESDLAPGRGLSRGRWSISGRSAGSRRVTRVLVGAVTLGLIAAGWVAMAARSGDAASPDPAIPAVAGDTPPAASPVIYTARDGFRLSVPVGWRIETFPGGAYFREPNSRRFLAVRRIAAGTADLEQLLAAQEKSVAARLPGYTLLDRRRVRARVGVAADWDFTWVAADGQQMRVRTRIARYSATQAYSLYQSAAARSGQNQGALQQMVASFRPPARK